MFFFLQAVDEPGFSVTYADLCHELSKFSVADCNFRNLLVNRCQLEFEKNPDLELNRNERMKEIEAETDPVSLPTIKQRMENPLNSYLFCRKKRKN